MSFGLVHPRLLVLPLALAIAGCSSVPVPVAPSPSAPVAARRARPVVGLVDVKLSRLLDFESDADLVFLRDRATARRVGGEAAHGAGSLRVVRGSDGVRIKLSTLLAGRAFPGSWNLIGLQVRAPEGDATLRLSLRQGGRELARRSIPVGSGDWDWAWLGLSAFHASAPTTAPSTAPAAEALELWASLDGQGTLLLDNVALGDNAREYPTPAFRIRLDGLRWVVESPGAFVTEIPSPESGVEGYLRQSIDAWRATFATRDGRPLVVERRGRAYADGRFRAIAALPDATAIERQHAHPGRVLVEDEAAGRVDLSSAGDRDNDGYDESRGSYRLAATGPRMQFTLAPAGSTLIEPLLEVRNLPAGELVVNVEGRLIDGCVRMSDGTVLVPLPLRVDRPTRVDLRVKPPVPAEASSPARPPITASPASGGAALGGGS